MHPLRSSSLLCVLLLTSAASAAPRVTGLDTVTTVGVPVNVRAKFEGGFSWFRPDLRNAPVTFTQVGSGLTLAGRTDADGVAEVAVRARVPGVYRFQASLDRRPDRKAESRVWVLDPARPVVVIDIDGTLSDLEELLVPFRGARADTFPGSPELVRELSATHQIVYLTARDDGLDAGTRAFLARHGFPEAPILYNDTGLWTPTERQQLLGRGHGEFKLETLQALQARGVDVVLGIGNAETDAFAYEGAGLPSMIRTSEVGQGPSFRFLDYPTQLRPKLVELGFLPAHQAGVVQAVTGS